MTPEQLQILTETLADFEQAEVREYLPKLHRRLGEVALADEDWAQAESEGQIALQLVQGFSNRNEERYSYLCQFHNRRETFARSMKQS